MENPTATEARHWWPSCRVDWPYVATGARHGLRYIQFGVNSDFTHTAGWLLAILVFVKILTTSLTIGSGGSGGVFGPGMVIGGFLGGALWALLNTVAPALVTGMPAGAFVVVGMCGFFGGIAKAPLAVILMVAEMTGEYSLIVPAMLTTMVAYLITGDTSIYEKQVPTRMDSPAHKDEFALPLLRNMSVRDAMKPLAAQLPTTVIPDTSLRDVARMMRENNLRDIPVTQNGHIVGIISARDLDNVPAKMLETDAAHARRVMRRTVAHVYPDESLYTAWVRMSRSNLRQLLVVSHDQSAQFIGILTTASIANRLRVPDVDQPGTQSDAPRTKENKEPLANQRVADAMGPAPEMIPPSTPLAQVRDMVLEQRVVLVADQHGAVWGIITPADITGRLRNGQDHELTAGDLAVHNLITASPNESLRAVNRRMISHGLRQVPVIKGKNVIGLLRRRDVLEAFERGHDSDMEASFATIPGDQH